MFNFVIYANAEKILMFNSPIHSHSLFFSSLLFVHRDLVLSFCVSMSTEPNSDFIQHTILPIAKLPLSLTSHIFSLSELCSAVIYSIVQRMLLDVRVPFETFRCFTILCV